MFFLQHRKTTAKNTSILASYVLKLVPCALRHCKNPVFIVDIG